MGDITNACHEVNPLTVRQGVDVINSRREIGKFGLGLGFRVTENSESQGNVVSMRGSGAGNTASGHQYRAREHRQDVAQCACFHRSLLLCL